MVLRLEFIRHLFGQRPGTQTHYPDRVLSDFDFVVASVHSRFKMSEKEQTERILKAIENPYTTILGHMIGRQLQRRPGYEIDIDQILKACAEHRVAVEINAHPCRLVLDWRWHENALRLRVHLQHQSRCSFHQGARYMHWGVEMACKGGVPPERVLNAMPLASSSAIFNAGDKPRRAMRPSVQK